MAKKSKEGKKSPNLIRAREAGAEEQTFSHPWNPNSEITGVMLGRKLGLKRLGVSIARLKPGKESFVPHAHQREEEWIYILSGDGLALLDDDEIEVGAGDFMAFPTPSVAHHLKNSGEDDLVYLMGGENLDVEIADFPTLGRRMLRVGDDITIYKAEDAMPFAGPAPEAHEGKAPEEEVRQEEKQEIEAVQESP